MTKTLLAAFAVMALTVQLHAAEKPANPGRPIVLVAGSERIFDLEQVVEITPATSAPGIITIITDFHPLGSHRFLTYGGPR